MICFVIAPDNVDLLTPSCINKFTVMVSYSVIYLISH